MKSHLEFNKSFLFFWLSQTASQLGSSITGYALMLWLYGSSSSAMTISLFLFLRYLPSILASGIAGPVVDRCDKKRTILVADSAAALATAVVALAFFTGRISMGLVYLHTIAVGVANAFQHPASSVLLGRLVHKSALTRASGLNSLTGSLISVLTPAIATAVVAAFGPGAAILLDLGSFAVAFLFLALFVKPPAEGPAAQISGKGPGLLAQTREGLRLMGRIPGLVPLMTSMAVMNLLSNVSMYNLLSPMILARTGGSTTALGLVNAAMGAGGIAGGLYMSAHRAPKKRIAMIYGSCALSFVVGDMLLSASASLPVWCTCVFSANLLVAVITAGQNFLFYAAAPQSLQGRVFAVRSLVQYSTIPLGLLLGGALADGVFEPFMQGGSAFAQQLSPLVGGGPGSGMALLFLLTGIIGFGVSLGYLFSPSLHSLDASASVLSQDPV